MVIRVSLIQTDALQGILFVKATTYLQASTDSTDSGINLISSMLLLTDPTGRI